MQRMRHPSPDLRRGRDEARTGPGEGLWTGSAQQRRPPEQAQAPRGRAGGAFWAGTCDFIGVDKDREISL